MCHNTCLVRQQSGRNANFVHTPSLKTIKSKLGLQHSAQKHKRGGETPTTANEQLRRGTSPFWVRASKMNERYTDRGSAQTDTVRSITSKSLTLTPQSQPLCMACNKNQNYFYHGWPISKGPFTYFDENVSRVSLEIKVSHSSLRISHYLSTETAVWAIEDVSFAFLSWKKYYNFELKPFWLYAFKISL